MATAALVACAHHSESGPNLTAVPAAVHWMDYQGMQVPAGADGPREIAGAATGFTHTPQGAALAAIVHTIRVSVAADGDWPQVLRYEIAPSPGKDSLATSRPLLRYTSRANPALAPRIRGYTLTSYTPAIAHVQIYTVYADRSIGLNLTTVVWLANDWRLRLPDPTSTTPVVKTAKTITAAVTLEAPQ